MLKNKRKVRMVSDDPGLALVRGKIVLDSYWDNVADEISEVSRTRSNSFGRASCIVTCRLRIIHVRIWGNSISFQLHFSSPMIWSNLSSCSNGIHVQLPMQISGLPRLSPYHLYIVPYIQQPFPCACIFILHGHCHYVFYSVQLERLRSYLMAHLKSL